MQGDGRHARAAPRGLARRDYMHQYSSRRTGGGHTEKGPMPCNRGITLKYTHHGLVRVLGRDRAQHKHLVKLSRVVLHLLLCRIAVPGPRPGGPAVGPGAWTRARGSRRVARDGAGTVPHLARDVDDQVWRVGPGFGRVLYCRGQVLVPDSRRPRSRRSRRSRLCRHGCTSVVERVEKRRTVDGVAVDRLEIMSRQRHLFQERRDLVALEGRAVPDHLAARYEYLGDVLHRLSRSPSCELQQPGLPTSSPSAPPRIHTEPQALMSG